LSPTAPGCKSGETLTSGLQDIVFTNVSYTITDSPKPSVGITGGGVWGSTLAVHVFDPLVCHLCWPWGSDKSP